MPTKSFNISPSAISESLQNALVLVQKQTGEFVLDQVCSKEKTSGFIPGAYSEKFYPIYFADCHSLDFYTSVSELGATHGQVRKMLDEVLGLLSAGFNCVKLDIVDAKTFNLVVVG